MVPALGRLQQYVAGLIDAAFGGIVSRILPFKGVTAADVYSDQITWENALRKGKLRRREAVIKAITWLVFCHCLQPLSYLAAFYAFADDLGSAQRFYAAVIAVRESFYLVGACFAACIRPSYLLINVHKTSEDLRGFMVQLPTIILYVVSPDKTVLYTLLDKGYCRSFLTLCLALADSAAIGALYANMKRGDAPLPLLFCYWLSVLAFVTTVHMWRVQRKARRNIALKPKGFGRLARGTVHILARGTVQNMRIARGNRFARFPVTAQEHPTDRDTGSPPDAQFVESFRL